MATSRSNETADLWTAGVRLFSGRPDPSWRLSPPWPGRLEEVWQALEPFPLSPPEPPPLGYRGCVVDGRSRGRWEAYQGFVTLSRPDGREVRQDPPRAFELTVFESAPPGALPERILELAGVSSENPG